MKKIFGGVKTWAVCSVRCKLRHCSLQAMGGWCVAFVVAQEATKWAWHLRLVLPCCCG